MEGWLLKRGPVADLHWQHRWCVLYPGAIEFFESEGRQRRRGSVELSPRSHAISFHNCRAPGDATKYVSEKPFGFVVDVDPSGGSSRRLYYFDAGTKEALASWLDALEEGIKNLGKLYDGDCISVQKECLSDSAKPILLLAGQVGWITTIDDNCDVVVQLEGKGMEEQQWLFKNKLVNLRKEVESSLKEVVLEIIPQSQFINHWALRVGASSSTIAHHTSRCYEFEGDGIRIGRRTALDKGYSMQSVLLKGVTTKMHCEIEAWARDFGQNNRYCAIGNDTLGGKNCQDFVLELCEFLGLDVEQLPWRQAQLAKVAGVAMGVALGPEVLAAGLVVATAGYFLDYYGSTSSCANAEPDGAKALPER